MLSRHARAAILGLGLFAWLATMAGPAVAGDLADFNATVEAAEAHNRVAIGYLRTGNTDLASLEIDKLRKAWDAFNARFAGKRPDAFDRNPLYGIMLTDISTRMVTADLMFKSGHPDVVRQALEAVRDDLYRLRKSAGIVVLADCVRDSNNAMVALQAFDKRELDWSKAETGIGIAGKAAIYGYVLRRCDETAGARLRKDPEFRRLIDGAEQSLTLIPKAIEMQDTNLLHRVLIELRALDNLLTFRFG
jgi:hypothetical protein